MCYRILRDLFNEMKYGRNYCVLPSHIIPPVISSTFPEILNDSYQILDSGELDSVSIIYLEKLEEGDDHSGVRFEVNINGENLFLIV